MLFPRPEPAFTIRPVRRHAGEAMHSWNQVRCLLISVVLALVSTMPARAAESTAYPTRMIRLIVPTAAGGTTDVLARLVADSLRTRLGQPVIVENRPGAGGLIAARAAAMAAPDGYTLLFGNTAVLATLPAVSKKPGYDPVKGFVAIAEVMRSFQVLVVGQGVPARNVAELIAYAKANPGKLNFGTAGPGNIVHLSGELFKAATGIDFVPVHFRSGPESVNAILGGQVQLTIDNVTAVRSWVEEGKLRALAVTSAERRSELPGVPTMVESGLPDYVVLSFFGVVAPAGTPAAIQDKLSSAIAATLATDAIRASLAKLGGEASRSTRAEFSALIASEVRRWGETARRASVTLD